MANKSKQQGTQWQRDALRAFEQEGLLVGLLAEQGQYDWGDMWIGAPPEMAYAQMKYPITVLLWKRLVDTGKQVRQPKGTKHMVVLEMYDFAELLKAAGVDAPPVVAELKARQQLSVSTVLEAASMKVMKAWRRMADARPKEDK